MEAQRVIPYNANERWHLLGHSTCRAKKECEPKDWEKVLGKVIEFTKDTSKFVFEKVPKFIIKVFPSIIE